MFIKWCLRLRRRENPSIFSSPLIVPSHPRSLQIRIILFHSTASVLMAMMLRDLRRNQSLGLLSSLGPYGLNNRGGSLLNRQHLFGGLDYCSCSTCEINPMTGEHTCMCYLASHYLQLGQYLIEECDCLNCPLLQTFPYGGGLHASGYGR